LGEVLWRANADAVLDAGWDDERDALSTYVFEPFPYPITAVEGLKAIACYRHQSAEDPVAPVAARLPGRQNSNASTPCGQSWITA